MNLRALSSFLLPSESPRQSSPTSPTVPPVRFWRRSVALGLAVLLVPFVPMGLVAQSGYPPQAQQGYPPQAQQSYPPQAQQGYPPPPPDYAQPQTGQPYSQPQYQQAPPRVKIRANTGSITSSPTPTSPTASRRKNPTISPTPRPSSRSLRSPPISWTSSWRRSPSTPISSSLRFSPPPRIRCRSPKLTAGASRWGMPRPPKSPPEQTRSHWDPSVKALTAFPQVLADLNRNLSWTTELGNAYYNQPQDVFSAIQAMRQRAQSAGNLQSTPQEQVTDDQGYIDVAPANPQVVYVPTYNPWTAYGAPVDPWPGFNLLGAIGDFGVHFGPGLVMSAFTAMPWGWLGWGLSWLGNCLFFDHGGYYPHGPGLRDWGLRYGGPRAGWGRNFAYARAYDRGFNRGYDRGFDRRMEPRLQRPRRI